VRVDVTDGQQLNQNLKASTFLNVSFEIKESDHTFVATTGKAVVSVINCFSNTNANDNIGPNKGDYNLAASNSHLDALFNEVIVDNQQMAINSLIDTTSPPFNSKDKTYKDEIQVELSNNNLPIFKANQTVYNISLYLLQHHILSFQETITQIRVSLLKNSDNIFRIYQKNKFLYIVSAIDWQVPTLNVIKGQRSFDHPLEMAIKVTNLHSKRVNNFFFNLNIIFKLKTAEMIPFELLPEPTLIVNDYYLTVDLTKNVKVSNDLVLIQNFNFYFLNDDDNDSNYFNQIYNISYSLKQQQTFLFDNLPVYIDSKTGRLVYYSHQKEESARNHIDFYAFKVLINFDRFNSNLTKKLTANIELTVYNPHQQQQHQQIEEENDEDDININTPTAIIDLSRPLTSADILSYLQCQPIGFFHIQHQNCRIKLKTTPTNNSWSRNEQKLLNNNFYSILYLDELTGALYLNLGDDADYYDNFNNKSDRSNGRIFYKLTKLIEFYLLDRDISSKRIQVDAQDDQNKTYSMMVELIFKKSNNKLIQIENAKKNSDQLDQLESTKNTFLINSNNFLNLFYNGDEFMINIDIDENTLSWQSDLINIRKYLLDRFDRRQSFVYLNLFKNVRFYLKNSPNEFKLKTNENLFQIVDNYNGILLTKDNVQFDFEVKRSYFVKIMMIQYLTDDEAEQHHSYEGSQQHFVYWLDLHINILNKIDEPFVCTQSVYTIDIDENAQRATRLFSIKIHDYDLGSISNGFDQPQRFSTQILTGNAQGLFEMKGLNLFTGSSSRKLDTETKDEHELELKITEIIPSDGYLNETTTTTTVPSRFAFCKIIINVNDLNDNRPIVNDIQLFMPDRLDPGLIIRKNPRIPIANAIAIDPDRISDLNYFIVAIRIQDATTNRIYTKKALHRQRKVRDQSETEDDDLEDNDTDNESNSDSNSVSFDNLLNFFIMNSTNGHLYANGIDMPCRECTIQIHYRARDFGRMRKRVSRKSSLKFLIKSTPVSFSLFFFLN
jgi:hypothetical protein